MAKHRCFSKDIVCSDDFKDMPISSQALYFHLGMEADDRGYVNNARSIIKTISATVGDLETLVNKKFVLVRQNNLILIKGWRINNTIQPSRLVETKYTDDLKQLFFDENNSYTETETERPVLSTTCQQIANNLSTQDKLSKDKLSKDNNMINSNTINRPMINRLDGIDDESDVRESTEDEIIDYISNYGSK